MKSITRISFPEERSCQCCLSSTLFLFLFKLKTRLMEGRVVAVILLIRTPEQ